MALMDTVTTEAWPRLRRTSHLASAGAASFDQLGLDEEQIAVSGRRTTSLGLSGTIAHRRLHPQ